MTDLSESKLIQVQQEVAFQVLDKLRRIDSNVVLAGGSLREWDERRPAKDLDFFLYAPVSSYADRSWLEQEFRTAFGWELDIVGRPSWVPKPEEPEREGEDAYERNENISVVFDCHLYRTPVQIIIWNEPIGDGSKLVGSFPLSKSMVCMDARGQVRRHPAYIAGFLTQEIYVKPEAEVNREYLDRITTKYPDHEVKGWEEVLNTIQWVDEQYPHADYFGMRGEKNTSLTSFTSLLGFVRPRILRDRENG